MKAIFIELPAFGRHRGEYFGDEAFRTLQTTLMKSLDAEDVIEGTGGLRKLRFADAGRARAEVFGSSTTGGVQVRSFGFTPSTTEMNATICRHNSARR